MMRQDVAAPIGETLGLPIALLVTEPAVVIPADASLGAAAAAMRARRVSALLVSPGGGLVSERELARCVGTDAGLPVDEVALADPVTVDATLTLGEAAITMFAEGVGHLVVRVPGGDPGIVSDWDILAALIAGAGGTDRAGPEIWIG